MTGGKTKQTFLSGVFLLTLSTLLVKLTGFLYKIPMLNLLGAVGMGYFNAAYEIYAFFCTIATAGLPVALSVLVASEKERGRAEQANAILKVSAVTFSVLGLLGSAALYFLADGFCLWIQSPPTAKTIKAISPTLFFVCFSSVFRGYSQGLGNMAPTAFSQVLESLGKLAFGLLFASNANRVGKTTEEISMAAGLGLSLGAALSALYLLAHFIFTQRFFFAKKQEKCGKYRETLQSILQISLPVTLGASAVSLTRFIDLSTILRRLQEIGLSEETANALYGCYTTLALPVYALVPSLINSVALPLVPLLSAAVTSKDATRQQELIGQSYRLVGFFAIPSAVALAFFSEPILLLLFRQQKEAVAVASPLLSILGVSVFLSCMITATNSVLHANRVVNRPIFFLLIGSAVKILSAHFLIGNSSVGLYGAPISTLICNLVVFLLNFSCANRLGKPKYLLKTLFLPLLPALSAALVAFFFQTSVFKLASFGFSYLFFAFLFRIIPYHSEKSREF